MSERSARRLDAYRMAAVAVNEGDRLEAARQLVVWAEGGEVPELRYRCAHVATELRTGRMGVEQFLARAQEAERFALEEEKKQTPVPRKKRR